MEDQHHRTSLFRNLTNARTRGCWKKAHSLYYSVCAAFHLMLFSHSFLECKGKKSGEIADWASCKEAEDWGGERSIHSHRNPWVSFYNMLPNCVWKATKSSASECPVCAPMVQNYPSCVHISKCSLDFFLKNFKLIINDLGIIKKFSEISIPILKYWHSGIQICCAEDFPLIINFHLQGHGNSPNED